MPFQYLKNDNSNNKIQQRKEQDSLLIHHFEKNSLSLFERASIFTSKGSITLEALFRQVSFC